jgi:hypothetical protein
MMDPLVFRQHVGEALQDREKISDRSGQEQPTIVLEVQQQVLAQIGDEQSQIEFGRVKGNGEACGLLQRIVCLLWWHDIHPNVGEVLEG